MSSSSSAQALEWIPRVFHEQRAEFEAAAVNDDFKNFEFSERTPEGDMVRRSKQSEYFPVYFLKPLAGNEPAVGFDLASNSLRRQTLHESMSIGKPLSTHIVDDGEKAMEFLYRQGGYQDAPRPGIILLDLNLPRKDGREVLADIKQDPSLKSIPVVVMTTSDSDKDILASY